jgi:hypothetical protein
MPTSLDSHTLESLCNELLAGRPVLFGAQNETFQLTSIESRAVFAWYRDNRSKWDNKVLREDIDRIVARLGTQPPAPPPTVTAGPGKARVLHLTRLKAHRFAGLHQYGAPNAPPDAFEFDFVNDITIFEGRNGAGKTSLLSAICWCLTGEAYRTQKLPTEVHGSISLSIGPSNGAANDTADLLTYATVAAAPVPSAEALASLKGKPLKVDTWVELTFCDDTGAEVAVVRREIINFGAQRFKMRSTGEDGLAVDPIALRLGTTFPGAIPHIKLGEASSIGEAVSSLTGIQPLQDLAKHASKVRDKLLGELPKECREEIARTRQQHDQAKAELTQRFLAHPDIEPKLPAVQSDDPTTAIRTIEQYAHHFGQLEAAWLADAPVLLGESFNPRDRVARRQLSQSIGPALGALQSNGDLPSAVRMRNLRLSKSIAAEVQALIDSIAAQAATIEEAAKEPLVAARRQLYTKVARWHTEHLKSDNIAACPVCLRALEGISDPHTGMNISAELQKAQEADDTAAKTVSEWVKETTARLYTDLPESLRDELDRDLPRSPIDLIKAAYCQELFRKPGFAGLLQPLQQVASEQWDYHLSPPRTTVYIDPESIALPRFIASQGAELARKMRRVQRALAFSEWRRANDAVCRTAYEAVVDRERIADQDIRISAAGVAGWSISRRLLALNSILEAAEPLRSALQDVELLRQKLELINECEKRLHAYARAAEALEPITHLERLVSEQVGGLVARLSNETIRWRNQIYQRETIGGPSVTAASVIGPKLRVSASVGGTSIDAQHVVNASDLRATLFAFLFALREYVLESRGGLSLLLLDDPQEMFDGWNRKRLAETVVNLGGKQCRPIVATSDEKFANDMDAYARGTPSLAARTSTRWSIHPCGKNRPSLGVIPYVGLIEKARHAFEVNENAHDIARQYAMYLRIWLEDRLFNLLGEATLPLKPTLSDLLGEIRGRLRDSREPFSYQSFRTLCGDSALVPGSQFLNVMNESHHFGGSHISYGDVDAVRGDCDRVRKLVDAAHEDCIRYLRREPPPEEPAMPPGPPAVALPSVRVPMLYGIAALADVTRTSEVVDDASAFDETWFESKAVYRLRTHNLGFSARYNDVVIVNLKPVQTEDGRVFIACHGEKVYARRVYRDRSQPGFVVLASETENPLKRAPTRILPASQVRLLKIVGVLFDGTETYDRSNEEAVSEPEMPRILREVTSAVSIQRSEELGGSAIPLALPGQTLLVGSELQPSSLEQHKGHYVVVSTTDGDVFKCVGDSVVGAPHVRMFDSVGGRGQSLLLRTEDVAGPFEKIPLLTRVRRVIGVLYAS